MLCLPNTFTLPIFLVITKCDEFKLSKPEKQFQEKETINGKIQGKWVKVNEIQKKEKLLAAGYSRD